MTQLLHRIAMAGLGAFALSAPATATCSEEMDSADTEALYMSYRTAQTISDAAAIASCLLTRDFSALGLIGADAAMLRADFADALAENGEHDRAVAILTALADQPDGDGPAAEYARLPALIQLAALEAERENFDEARRYIDRAVAAAEAASDPDMRAAVRWPLQVRLEIEHARLAVAAPEQAENIRAGIATTQSDIEAIDDRLLSRRQRLGLLTGDIATAAPEADARFADIGVFFATPRARAAHASPTGAFSFEHGAPSFGRALVSAPYAPALSAITPRMRVSASARESGLDDAMLDDVIVFDGEDAFADQLRRATTAQEARELLVYAAPAFISFDAAAETAAELALALEIEGATAVYAPALHDDAAAGAADIAAFIETAGARADARSVYVVTHAEAAAAILSSDIDAGEALSIRLAILATSDDADALSRMAPPDWLEQVAIYTEGHALSPADEISAAEGAIDIVALTTDDAPLLDAALNDLRAEFWFSASPEARCFLVQEDGARVWRNAPEGAEACSSRRFQLAATTVRRLGAERARAQIDEQIASGENAEAWRAVRAIVDALAAPDTE